MILTDGQDPLWHLSEHSWNPQVSFLEHVSPHEGMDTVHGNLWEVLPHEHVLSPLDGHSPHDPSWQVSSHWWWPHL